jgi:arylsulfatase A-like enzyme
VRLVVAGAGVSEPGVVDAPATALDLHATFLDHAGYDPVTVDPATSSRSTRSYLDGSADAGAPSREGGLRDVVFSGYGPWRMAYDGQYRLIRAYDPESGPRDIDPWSEAALRDSLRDRDPVLFGQAADPDELENRAPGRPRVVERLDALSTVSERPGSVEVLSRENH